MGLGLVAPPMLVLLFLIVVPAVQAATFSLQQVVKGFTQGIGGGSGVPPMKVGGRRIMILPPALGYGAQSQGSIPANAPLVFVVDLLAVK